jgi:hypothetical protein
MFSVISSYKESGDISGCMEALKNTELREEERNLVNNLYFLPTLFTYFNGGFVTYHHFLLSTMVKYPNYVEILYSYLEWDVKNNCNISFYRDLSIKYNLEDRIKKLLNKSELLEYSILHKNVENFNSLLSLHANPRYMIAVKRSHISVIFTLFHYLKDAEILSSFIHILIKYYPISSDFFIFNDINKELKGINLLTFAVSEFSDDDIDKVKIFLDFKICLKEPIIYAQKRLEEKNDNEKIYKLLLETEKKRIKKRKYTA